MGGVCGAEEDEGKHRRVRNQTGKTNLQRADENASVAVDANEVDNRIYILQRGESSELQKMVDEYDEDINEYTFGQNKTLLLQAVISCENPDVIGYIMEKGANINLPEAQTGNTALFLAAIDLKVEFIRELLKYNPRFDIKNKSGMDIFEYIDFQLIEARKRLKRDLDRVEKRKYNQILQLLKAASGRDEGEELDE
mgnify:CR=1 FL=1